MTPDRYLHQLLRLSRGLDARFGTSTDDPYAMGTRLAEEIGELAQEVNRRENAASKRDRPQPDRADGIAGETLDVFRAVMSIVDQDGGEERLADMVDGERHRYAVGDDIDALAARGAADMGDETSVHAVVIGLLEHGGALGAHLLTGGPTPASLNKILPHALGALAAAAHLAARYRAADELRAISASRLTEYQKGGWIPC